MDSRYFKRCVERAEQIERLDDGTIIVPSVAACPNRTVAAWARYLGIDLRSARMMIMGEPGRCWIKHPGQTSVTAYG
jgi:hypothetical protein